MSVRTLSIGRLDDKGTCTTCGDEFDMPARGRPKTFCSRTCQVKAYQAGRRIKAPIDDRVMQGYRIVFYVNEDMASAIEDAVERSGMTISAWMREVIADSLDEQGYEEDPA